MILKKWERVCFGAFSTHREPRELWAFHMFRRSEMTCNIKKYMRELKRLFYSDSRTSTRILCSIYFRCWNVECWMERDESWGSSIRKMRMAQKKFVSCDFLCVLVKLNFMKTISERLNSVNVAIISGHKWNENKFHIKYSSGRIATTE